MFAARKPRHQCTLRVRSSHLVNYYLYNLNDRRTYYYAFTYSHTPTIYCLHLIHHLHIHPNHCLTPRDYRVQVYKYVHITWPDLHPYKIKSLLIICKTVYDNLQLHIDVCIKTLLRSDLFQTCKIVFKLTTPWSNVMFFLESGLFNHLHIIILWSKKSFKGFLTNRETSDCNTGVWNPGTFELKNCEYRLMTFSLIGVILLKVKDTKHLLTVNVRKTILLFIFIYISEENLNCRVSVGGLPVISEV